MSDYSLLTTLQGDNGLFGSSTSVSFDYLVVGNPNYSTNDPIDPEPFSNVGLVKVYKTSNNGSTWSDHDQLKSPEYESGNPIADQNFGNSVSISESIIAVGERNATVGGNTGSGRVHIYKIDTNTTEWTLSKTFSDADKSSGGGINYNFGESVSISGNYLIVGEPGDHDSANKGRVTIYKTTDNGTTWSNLMDYSGASNDLLGSSVYITGQYAIASGLGTSTNYGVAYIFYQNSGGSDNWGVSQTITSGSSSDTGFGISVSLYGDYAVIGEEDGNSGTGKAIVYYKDQGGITDSWGVVKTLIASDGSSDDKFGNSVAIFEDVIIVGAYSDDTSPHTNNGSAYVYVTTDDWSTVTENKIVAENPSTNGNFSSNTVSLSSKYIIVGYENYNNQGGAVGIYKIPKQYYSILNKILPDDNTSINAYGVSTAIYGDTIVIGSVLDNSGIGCAYVYTYSGGSYTRTKLTPSSSNAASGDQFGISVSIDKNYIAVGAYKDDSTGVSDHGSVYIFEKSGSTWPSTETQKIVTDPLVSSDQLGGCVAIKDNYVVIGRAPFSGSGNSTTTKKVSVWRRDPSDSTWKDFQTITANDEAINDHFGESVSIDNDYIVVGAGTDDDTATDSGSVYIYYKPTDYWIQIAKIQASTPNASYYFGRNVKISGHTIAISEIANLSSSSTNQGYVYIFDSTDGLSWTQTKQIIGPIVGERFGGDIALYGNYLLVGSRLGDLTESNIGYSYIYYKDEGGTDNWGLKKKIINYGSVLNDYSGYAIALSGSTGVITAYFDDDIGDRSGGAYTINVEEETVSDPNLSSSHVIFVQSVGTNNTYVSTDAQTVYETNKGSFLSYYNDLTKFRIGEGLRSSSSSAFFSYSLNMNSSTYIRSLNRVNTIRINIKVPTYSASSNIRTNGSVTYFTLNSTASGDGWTMTTYYADNENGVGSIDIVLVAPSNAWTPVSVSRDTYNLIDFDITATNAQKLEHLFKDSFWETDSNGDVSGLSVIVSLKDSSYLTEDVIFKYPYDAVNIYTYREPCKTSEIPDTGILSDNSKVSKDGTVLYTGHYEDGDFPTPLVCYSDAIVYGIGDDGSYPSGFDGDGVFLVAQFDEYPYDPFATLLPDTTWLQMFVKQSSKDTSKWIVSFHARMDVVYNISSASGSDYYKIADFVPSTGITMSGVLSSISNIRWGFYGTDRTTAYYYSPIYGTYNYINDQSSVSSSGITILSSPSKSSTVVSQTQHQNVCSFGTRLASNFSFNRTYEYGAPVSMYTTDGSSNSLRIYNPVSYNGLRTSTRMFPFTNDQDSDYNIDISLQYIKKIEIKSSDFNVVTEYFNNIISGWTYSQSSDLGIVTITFEYTDNGYGYTLVDTVDNTQLAIVNVTGHVLTNFIGLLSAPLNSGNKVTYNVYYTNNDLNSNANAVSVTIGSETYKTVSDDFHNNYYYSQEGYDGVFQLRLKESYSSIDPSTDSLNSNLNLILTERGSVKEVRKSSDTSTKTSVYTISNPSTESDPPTVIDVTERFGKHIHMFIRDSGKIYVRNGLRYYDNSTSVFDYKPYDTEYSAPTWTGLKSFSMASTLFDSSITYFTDTQSGWSYTQTVNDDTVTLSFEYTGNVNGIDLNPISGIPVNEYVGKPNINVDIISGIMRTVYSAGGPNIVYTYEYFGSDGSITQTGYDGVFGVSVELGAVTDSQDTLLAYDTEKNLIDEQGSIITASAADPHVMPITGEPYDLPHEDRTFLLYYNNNSEYPMSIKGKCWHLPESKYKRNIQRLHEIGYHERAEKYLNLFENNTYFRYIEFVCGHEQIIVDMESLWYCSMTTVEDVDNFTLPHLPSYENNSFISITDFAHSKTGIISVRPPNKTTLERTITMNGPDTIIQLKLMIDSRDITNRNGIIIKVRGPIDEHIGSLVRKSIIYSDFSEKLNVLVVPNHLLTKKLFNNKVYTASSYGATKEEYEYDQLDIFTSCANNVPNKDKTYLLYSNNDINYPITIKTKCWYIPEEKYINKLNKMRNVGYNERAQKYEKIFKKHTFMRYVEFVCCEETLIIDMESLWYYSALSMEQVNNFDLTRLKGYKNNKHISITDFEHSKTGLNVKRVANKTTVQRIVTLRGKNIFIEARLMLDTRNITERNNMEVKIMGLKDHHNGLLVDNEIIETQFSFSKLSIEMEDTQSVMPISEILKINV
jgi:hypothetical protein